MSDKEENLTIRLSYSSNIEDNGHMEHIVSFGKIPSQTKAKEKAAEMIDALYSYIRG